MPPPSVPDLTAVVVSHNSEAVLAECLRALAREAVPTIVVDSGSSDGSTALVERRFPAVRLLRAENVGFGSACNLGLAQVTSETVLVLNADAWPLPGAVARLAAVTVDPSVAAVGPRLVSLDARPQRSVIAHPVRVADLVAWTLAPRVTRGAYLLTRRFCRSPTEAVRGRHFLMGAALLLRREAFEAVGGFDPDFFMYDEDVDLCHRLVRGGWTIRFEPGSTFVHLGGASSSAAADAMRLEQLRSHVRFIAKHRGASSAARARVCLGLALSLRALLERGSRRAADRRAGRWLLGTDTAGLLRTERAS